MILKGYSLETHPTPFPRTTLVFSSLLKSIRWMIVRRSLGINAMLAKASNHVQGEDLSGKEFFGY